jgi:hypothetical protein
LAQGRKESVSDLALALIISDGLGAGRKMKMVIARFK